MAVWIGLDQGADTRAHAECVAEAILGPLLERATLACTHVAFTPSGHYATSVELPAPVSAEQQRKILQAAEQTGCAAAIVDATGEHHVGGEALVSAAQDAALRNRARADGRAFRFRGMERLRGRIPVADLIENSAIDGVQALGGFAEPSTTIDTMDFIRPYVLGGTLVLAVTPLADGSFGPYEVPQPHGCCADHG